MITRMTVEAFVVMACDNPTELANRPRRFLPEDFAGADLRGVTFPHGIELMESDFAGANLSGAVFRNTSLRGSRFDNANLSSASFSMGCRLQRSSFVGADMSWAATGATPTGTDGHTPVNFEHCIFHDANLELATLQYAYFQESKFHNTNFAGSLLGYNINMRHTLGIYDAGFDTRGYHFFAVAYDNKPSSIRIKAGCRWFTLDQALAHWQHNRDATRRVLLLTTAAEEAPYCPGVIEPQPQKLPGVLHRADDSPA